MPIAHACRTTFHRLMPALAVVYLLTLSLLGLTLCSSAFAADAPVGGWELRSLSALGSKDGLGDVFFLNDKRGWMLGSSQESYSQRSAVLFSSVDGGATWSRRVLSEAGVGVSLRALTFVDAQHGWAVGSTDDSDTTFQPLVVVTADGGTTWHAQDIPHAWDGAWLDDVSFADGSHGWAVGWCGGGWTDGMPAIVPYIVATEDGGATWHTQRPASVEVWDGQAGLNSVRFVDARHGWAVGSHGAAYRESPVIMVTSDGGASWHTQRASNAYDGLYSVDFVDAQHGWAVGGAGGEQNGAPALIWTADGGGSWHNGTPPKIAENSFIHAVDFADATHGWAVGTRNSGYEGPGPVYVPVILCTSDGGRTWREQDSSSAGERGSLNSVSVTDALHGWISGQSYDDDTHESRSVLLVTSTGGAAAATRADLLTAANRLRDALIAQYERDLDLTASTYIYTSEYRREAKISENLAFWSKKLSEGLGVVSTGLGATGKSLKELVTGKVAEKPELSNAFLQGMAEGQRSVEYRAAGVAAGVNGLIGDVSSAEDYDLWPDGYGKLSKAADALRRKYEKQGLDAAITKMAAELENSGASPFVPLRAASWPSGIRPKAQSWAMAPVQVRSAIRRTFADLAKALPDPLPAGYDAAAVVARLNALRRQVVKSGERRVSFAFAPALSGPQETTRRISLGMIDANWNGMSRLENAFLKRLDVRKWQSVKATVDGGLSVVSMMTAGAGDAVAVVTEQVNMSAQLVSQEITFPKQTVSPMNAMNENEFEMSMYLVEELANRYEIASCTSSYVKATLPK